MPLRLRAERRWFWPAGILIAVAAIGAGAFWFWAGQNATKDNHQITTPVTRGDLRIAVLCNGNLKATRKQEIVCKVKGQTTIIHLINEGVILTDDDVKNGRVLVELDSSRLRDERDQQEINVAAAKAALTQAEEAYAIQKNLNDSNIKKAELAVKFHKMDEDRFLGEKLSNKLMSAAEANYSKLAESDELGGAALQQRLQLESNIELAREEVQRAKDKVDGTKRLEQKGYVTRTELLADELALKRNRFQYDQAEIALKLFVQYEFPKQTEQFRSDVEEAQKELERVAAMARSALAQQDAELKSKQATYKLQADKLKEMQEQISFCTMRAEQPGMVVYASSTDWRGNPQDVIEEGAMIRERQAILNVPDMNSMAVSVKVHESVVKRVKPEQQAMVKIDALPDQEFVGKITKVAILPDSTNWWLNPDLREYSAEVLLEDKQPNLKPGMSAKVEIIIEDLRSVLYVPVQAVHTQESGPFCYVPTPNGSVARAVKLGPSDDTFVQIVSGLQEGEPVLLRATSTGRPAAQSGDTGGSATPTPAPPASAPPNEAPRPKNDDHSKPGTAGHGPAAEKSPKSK